MTESPENYFRRGLVQRHKDWQADQGRLTCRWDAQRLQQNPAWMQEIPDIQGSYLEPVPDFASHSPFGGPSVRTFTLPSRSPANDRLDVQSVDDAPSALLYL